MACVLLCGSAVRVHDSQAYRKMEVIRERISRILELIEMLLSFQIVFNLVNAAVMRARYRRPEAEPNVALQLAVRLATRCVTEWHHRKRHTFAGTWNFTHERRKKPARVILPLDSGLPRTTKASPAAGRPPCVQKPSVGKGIGFFHTYVLTHWAWRPQQPLTADQERVKMGGWVPMSYHLLATLS